MWQVREPVLLQTDEGDGEGIDYKYVIVNDDRLLIGDRWEDLGSPEILAQELDLQMLGFEGEAASGAGGAPSFPAGLKDASKANRRLSPLGNCLLLRSDEFGLPDSRLDLSWPVCPTWAPGQAGGGAVVGRGKQCNSLNPIYKRQYELPMRLFVKNRRGSILSMLALLAARLCLPPGVWPQIFSFVGTGPLGSSPDRW